MTTVAMDGSLHGGQLVGPLVMQRDVDTGGDDVDMPRGACEQRRASERGSVLQGGGSGRQKLRDKPGDGDSVSASSSRPPTRPRSSSSSSMHPPLPALHTGAAHRETATAAMATAPADEEDEDALELRSHPSQTFYRSRGSTVGSSGSDVLVADGETSVSGGDSSRQQGNSDFIIREGWLHRRGQVIKSWSRQYFALFETELLWFSDDAKRHSKGSIKILPETQLEEANFRLNCFCLVTGSRRLCVAAADNTEKLIWMELLGAAINMAREIKRDSLLQSWRVFESVPSADEKVSSIMSHRRDRAKVLVKVGSARGLLGKDRSGMSSPYAVVKLGRTVVKTQVKRRTLEPSWGEIFIFDYDRSIRQAMVEVYDWDNFSRDRFLGRVVIPLYLAYSTPMDRWFALGKRSIKSRVCGEIQLRVVLMAQPDLPAETSMRYLQSLEDLRIPLLPPAAPSYTDSTTDTAPSGEAACGSLWLPLPHTERLEDISYAVELTSSAFGGAVSIQGQLLLTNYRLVFLSDRKRMVASTHTGQHTQVPEVMTEVPIRLIATVKVMKGATMALKVRCKDARKLVFTFLSTSSTCPPTQPPSPPQEPVTPVGSRGSGALVVASGAYAGIPGLVPPSVAGGSASHSMSLGGGVISAPHHVRGAHGSMSGNLLATLSQTVTRARSASVASTTQQQHSRKSSGQSTGTTRTTRSSSGSGVSVGSFGGGGVDGGGYVGATGGGSGGSVSSDGGGSEAGGRLSRRRSISGMLGLARSRPRSSRADEEVWGPEELDGMEVAEFDVEGDTPAQTSLNSMLARLHYRITNPHIEQRVWLELHEALLRPPSPQKQPPPSPQHPAPSTDTPAQTQTQQTTEHRGDAGANTTSSDVPRKSCVPPQRLESAPVDASAPPLHQQPPPPPPQPSQAPSTMRSVCAPSPSTHVLPPPPPQEEQQRQQQQQQQQRLPPPPTVNQITVQPTPPPPPDIPHTSSLSMCGGGGEASGGGSQDSNAQYTDQNHPPPPASVQQRMSQDSSEGEEQGEGAQQAGEQGATPPSTITDPTPIILGVQASSQDSGSSDSQRTPPFNTTSTSSGLVSKPFPQQATQDTRGTTHSHTHECAPGRVGVSLGGEGGREADIARAVQEALQQTQRLEASASSVPRPAPPPEPPRTQSTHTCVPMASDANGGGWEGVRRVLGRGWAPHDLSAEYKRMGLPDAQWKVSHLNVSFGVCATYPQLLVVPSTIADDFVRATAGCRSKNRLPVLTWRHKTNLSTMCRSSQPVIGIKPLFSTAALLANDINTAGVGGSSSSSSEDDMVLLEHIHTASGPRPTQPPPPPARINEDLTNLRSTDSMELMVRIDAGAIQPQPPPPPLEGYVGLDGRRREKYVVIDARPELNARANQVTGMGFENTPQYQQVCQVLFMDIGNIHVMRRSLDALETLCYTRDVNSSSFGQQAESTRWLYHVHKVLVAALFIANLMHNKGISCLMHCSDGWDRTTQLCALAQLLMDPYYRTFAGFQVLVEKEWCHFGHKFSHRTGLDEHAWASHERSPVFHQWLDCVHQVIRQIPWAFEFNESLLVFLAHHVNSGWFGNFLFNSEKERLEARVYERTLSIWSAVDADRQRFLNPGYRSTGSEPELLTPVVSAKRLVLWDAFLFRWQTQLYGLAWRSGLGSETLREDGDYMRRVTLVGNNGRKLQLLPSVLSAVREESTDRVDSEALEDAVQRAMSDDEGGA